VRVASARKSLAVQQPKLPKGRPRTQAAKGSSPHEKKTTGNATRRVVHPSVSGRPTSPEQNRTQDLVAHHPWVAPGPHACVRSWNRCTPCSSALSDPDGPRQIGQLRRRLLRFTQVGETLKKLFSPTLEKAFNVSLMTSCCHRRRMRWSGATGAIARCKTGLPGTHASTDQCTLGAGHVARSPRRRAPTHPPHLT